MFEKQNKLTAEKCVAHPAPALSQFSPGTDLTQCLAAILRMYQSTPCLVVLHAVNSDRSLQIKCYRLMCTKLNHKIIQNICNRWREFPNLYPDTISLGHLNQ